MTNLTATKPQKIGRLSKRMPTAGQLSFGLFSFFSLLLILRNSAVAVEYVTRGLLLCAKSVIPSLFPFMVLSEILISGGIAEHLPRPILAPLRWLLGIPDIGCCAVLLGMICGFPVGAKSAMLAYENQLLTRKDAERVMICSGNPSSAFLIGAVGGTLWNNPRFGMALYGVVIGVSLLTGFLARCISPPAPPCPMPKAPPAQRTVAKGAKLFTNAIRSSTRSMLLVCAYVIFFSALMGTLGLVLGRFSVPNEACATLFCLFELSGGVSQSAGIGNVMLGAALTAFAAGWSGLSVHCQLLSVCDGKGLSFRAYFLAKLFQGLLCALLFSLLLQCFPSLLIPAEICARTRV